MYLSIIWSFAFITLMALACGASDAIKGYSDKQARIATEALEKAHKEEINRRLSDTIAEAAKNSLLASSIKPHILLNLLLKAAALIKQDVKLAEDYLLACANYLRLVIDSSVFERVKFQVERNIILRYAELSKIMLNGNMTININWDPALDSCYLPPLLIQPIVENAIVHGLNPVKNERVFELRVSAHRKQDLVFVEVMNDGLLYDGDTHEGVGISSIRARLRFTYPECKEANYSITTEGKWTISRLVFAAEET